MPKTPNIIDTSTAQTKLGAALAGAAHVVLRDVEIPGLGRAKLRLLTRIEEREVHLDMAKWMRTLAERDGISPENLAVIGAGMQLSVELSTRFVAVAVRDPDDPSKPFGSREQWERMPDYAISSMWDAYTDLVEELDPLAARNARLTEAEFAEIARAAMGKDIRQLTPFGSAKLALYVTTSGDRQPS